MMQDLGSQHNHGSDSVDDGISNPGARIRALEQEKAILTRQAEEVLTTLAGKHRTECKKTKRLESRLCREAALAKEREEEAERFKADLSELRDVLCSERKAKEDELSHLRGKVQDLEHAHALIACHRASQIESDVQYRDMKISLEQDTERRLQEQRKIFEDIIGEKMTAHRNELLETQQQAEEYFLELSERHADECEALLEDGKQLEEKYGKLLQEYNKAEVKKQRRMEDDEREHLFQTDSMEKMRKAEDFQSTKEATTNENTTGHSKGPHDRDLKQDRFEHEHSQQVSELRENN
ncbi:uncharacterized protein J7T54_007608 [Emericellopsis cladophorae]|uniref:Uncharacterized protein n=1 Tax=Emericellopsis cladophorae TaxID=2686198 RepID=A0A9Q0BA52_9HYPO|nr:uncharacterized protein J7T54_007608 [Emericellopsis cladophorae]KAI6778667.1 hypothetical protein J7T54_007608 [Emericellopsis cladophorae]